MLPIAIGIGIADPSFRSPMSIAVIGGLITSTVLSLLVVPVMFPYMDDLEQAMRGMRGRLRRKPVEPAAGPAQAPPESAEGRAV